MSTKLEQLADEAIASLTALAAKIEEQRIEMLAVTNQALSHRNVVTGEEIDIVTKQAIFNKVNEAFQHDVEGPVFFAMIQESRDMIVAALGLNDPKIVAEFGGVDTIN